QFHMESVELSEFLQETINLTIPMAARNKITVRLAEMPEAPPYVSTDRERIKQVLLNLLSNAVKFNRSGGSVTIAAARTEQAFWRVSVTDTGMGIPQDKLDRLFVPFERLGTKEGGTEGGIGLGLALCHRLVKALDGRLGAASTVGLGSTFWIDLPAIQIEAESIADPTKSKLVETDSSNAKYTLLYIEDDLANYYLLERILAPRKDIKLLSALQGRLGLDLAREHQPDLLVLDLRLAATDGLSLLRQIRAEGCDTPTVILTMSDSEDDMAAALRAGVRGYLLKDMEPEEVIDAISRAARGEMVVASAMMLKFSQILQSGPKGSVMGSLVASLTEREREVLGMIAEGASIPPIAKELYLAPSTVKTHVQRLYEKLGVGDRAAAVAEAMRRRLLE
ncbi:MAG: ATP-binding protein, partial [Actinomycetes bacterium]